METTVQTVPQDGILTFSTPLFLVFSEYLGYVSDYIDYASEWCEGKKPADEIAKFLEIEAMCIYRDMIKTMTIKEIKEWYGFYHPLFLSDYEKNLKELEAKGTSS